MMSLQSFLQSITSYNNCISFPSCLMRYIISYKKVITDDFVSSGSAVGTAFGLSSSEFVINCEDNLFTKTTLLRGEFGKGDCAFFTALPSEPVGLYAGESLKSNFVAAFCLLLRFPTLSFCRPTQYLLFFFLSCFSILFLLSLPFHISVTVFHDISLAF